MALQRDLRIAPGDTWRGRHGFGPRVRIVGIDPDTRKVHYAYVPTDPVYPEGSCNIDMFLDSYQLETKA